MMCTAETRFNTIGVQKVAVSNKRTYDMHIRICGLSSPERKASCKTIFGSSSSESQNFTISSEYNIGSNKSSSVLSKKVRKLLQDCYQNKTAMSPIMKIIFMIMNTKHLKNYVKECHNTAGRLFDVMKANKNK